MSAALHADAAVASIDHCAHALPVGLHIKIAQAARPAKGVPVVGRQLAANPAKLAASRIFAVREALALVLPWRSLIFILTRAFFSPSPDGATEGLALLPETS